MAWTLPDNGTSSSSRPSFVRPRLAHTATLTKSGQSIYYIGGLQVSESEVLSSAPMNEILEYHIANNTWIMHKSPENTTIPSPRRLHTATQGSFLKRKIMIHKLVILTCFCYSAKC